MRLCHIDEIEESGSKGFVIDREHQVFAVKKQGKVYVYKNSCPHLGIPLEMMPDQFLDIDKSFIQCSTHGALFEIENGFCIAGPCSGASLEEQPYSVIEGEIHIECQ